MLTAPEVVTTVVVGVMVGVEFSVAFVHNRILNALPEDSGQLGRAHGGRILGVVMPVWYLTSLALVAVWAIAGWHHHGTGLVVTAGALLILSVTCRSCCSSRSTTGARRGPPTTGPKTGSSR